MYRLRLSFRFASPEAKHSVSGFVGKRIRSKPGGWSQALRARRASTIPTHGQTPLISLSMPQGEWNLAAEKPALRRRGIPHFVRDDRGAFKMTEKRDDRGCSR